MIVGKDENMLKHLKYMSTQCKDDPHFYIHDEIGFNYRMTNVQAAIGVAQMEELEEFIVRKNRNYDLYANLLKGTDKGRLLPFRDGVRSNRWFYSFALDRKVCTGDVREYILKLDRKGIQTRPIWGLIHEQKPYRSALSWQIDKAKVYSEQVINIPCSTNLTEDEIRNVAEELRNL